MHRIWTKSHSWVGLPYSGVIPGSKLCPYKSDLLLGVLISRVTFVVKTPESPSLNTNMWPRRILDSVIHCVLMKTLHQRMERPRKCQRKTFVRPRAGNILFHSFFNFLGYYSHFIDEENVRLNNLLKITESANLFSYLPVMSAMFAWMWLQGKLCFNILY